MEQEDNSQQLLYPLLQVPGELLPETRLSSRKRLQHSGHSPRGAPGLQSQVLSKKWIPGKKLIPPDARQGDRHPMTADRFGYDIGVDAVAAWRVHCIEDVFSNSSSRTVGFNTILVCSVLNFLAT